jgi:hypothetical protein
MAVISHNGAISSKFSLYIRVLDLNVGGLSEKRKTDL